MGDSNIYTKVSVTKLAAALRKKRTELQAERKAALAKYKKDFAAWQKALADWVKANAADRAGRITQAEVEAHRSSYDTDKPQFSTNGFFFGSPKPPKKPGDQQIRHITAFLRQLSVTGQTTINLSTSQASKYLEDGKELRE